MILDKIIDEINKLSAIVNSWKRAQTLPDIEREIVLDKLRKLYCEVMFFEREVIEDNASFLTEETASATADVFLDVVDKVTQDEPAETPKIIATESSAIVEEEDAQEELTNIENIDEPTFDDMELDELQDIEVEEEIATETNVLEEEDEIGVEECEAGQADSGQVSLFEQALFSDESFVRAKVDKQVILSLYGDDNRNSAAPKYDASQSQQLERFEQPSISHPKIEPQPINAHLRNEGAITSGVKKVWGEMLTNSDIPLNEKIGAQNVHRDMASKICDSRQIKDLKQSIGINDKFTIIRDLFGGSATAYEAAISRLNEFIELDEAMIYIAENYSWDPNSKTVAYLVDLLEKKLN